MRIILSLDISLKAGLTLFPFVIFFHYKYRDVIEDPSSIPPTINNHLVLLVDVSRMPHPDIWDDSHTIYIIYPSKIFNIKNVDIPHGFLLSISFFPTKYNHIMLEND